MKTKKLNNSKTIFLVLTSLLLLAGYARAQTKKSRILFLVDASSSMTYGWQPNENRFQAARKVMLAIMDSIYAINNEVEFALRCYGTQYPAAQKMCTDTKLEVDFGLQNISQMNQRMKSIQPLGSSPIAYSLLKASENELSNNDKYDYSFILITDGGESCDGDICAAYSKIIANKVKVTPYIIGLDTNQLLLKYYECLGKYVTVTKANDIALAVKMVVDENRPLLEKKKNLGLKTQYSDVGQLPTPDFSGEPAILKALQKAEQRLVLTTKMTVPGAKRIKPRQPVSIESLYEPVRLPVDNLAVLSGIKSRKIIYDFVRPIPVSRWKNKKIELSEELLTPPSKDMVVLSPLIIASKLKKTEIKLVDKNGKTLPQTKATMPELVFSKESINLLALDKIESRLSKRSISFVDKKPKLLSTTKTILPELVFSKERVELQQLAKNEPTLKLSPKFKSPKGTTVAPLEPTPIKIDFVQPVVIVGYLNGNPPTKRTVNLKNKPGKVLAGRANTPIVIEQEMMEPVNLTTLWTNPFRLSYTESRPKPPAPLKLTKRKQVVPQPIVKKAPTPSQKEEEPDFKTERVDNADTRIQIYFTDGNGKFYFTKPDVAIVDPTTKNIVKSFTRTVTAGKPDPIKLDFDGIYDVTVLGQKDIVLHNVAIEKNKLNIVTLKVEKGTLIINYLNNKDRPVEFNATVFTTIKKDVEPVQMKCTEVRMFEPSNIRIQIDMLPVYEVSTEISFGAITEIQIPQPGAVQFTNMENIGNVMLYVEKRDVFNYFHTVQVNGNMPSQRVVLRPGLYQASYIPAGKPEGTPPILVKFIVKSNYETSVELKYIGDNVISPEGPAGKLIYIKEEAPQINIDTGGRNRRR